MPVCFPGMSLLEWSDWWGHGVGECVEPFLVAARGHYLPESRPLAAGRPPLVVMDWTTTPLPCSVLDKEEGQGGQGTQSQHEADHEGDNPTLSNQNQSGPSRVIKSGIFHRFLPFSNDWYYQNLEFREKFLNVLGKISRVKEQNYNV